MVGGTPPRHPHPISFQKNLTFFVFKKKKSFHRERHQGGPTSAEDFLTISVFPHRQNLVHSLHLPPLGFQRVHYLWQCQSWLVLACFKNALVIFRIVAVILNVLFDSCHGLAKGGSTSVVSEVIIVSAVS